MDGRTRRRLWPFQMVQHDIWDNDDATDPKLLTVRHDGKSVEVVAQVSKQGLVWVFDRVTGEPLWPIEERPVPRSDMPGETVWPTQPFPVKPPPFERQKFTVDDLSPFLSPQDRARFRDEILSARDEGLLRQPPVHHYTPHHSWNLLFRGVAAQDSVHLRHRGFQLLHPLPIRDPRR